MTTTPLTPDPFFHLPASGMPRSVHKATKNTMSTAISKQRLNSPRQFSVSVSTGGATPWCCRSARHAVELSLKFATSRLRQAGVIAHTRPTDHDIAADYAVLNAARLGDETLTRDMAGACPLAAIDRDGQMLRYARTRDGDKSMDDKSLANIAVIHASLEKLKGILDAIKCRVVDLVDERRTGTFTPDCSRRDLMEITRLLPPRNQWRDTAFDEAKGEIRTRLAIGSNKFASALNVIQANREMGGMLGLRFPLAHLSDAHTLYAISQWRRRHPDRQEKPLGIDYFERTEIDWQAMKEDAHIGKEVNEAVLSALSVAEIADLDTISYLGRDRVPCEYACEAHGSAARDSE